MIKVVVKFRRLVARGALKSGGLLYIEIQQN